MSKTPEEYFQEQSFSVPGAGDGNAFSAAELTFIRKYMGIDAPEALSKLGLGDKATELAKKPEPIPADATPLDSLMATLDQVKPQSGPVTPAQEQAVPRKIAAVLDDVDDAAPAEVATVDVVPAAEPEAETAPVETAVEAETVEADIAAEDAAAPVVEPDAAEVEAEAAETDEPVEDAVSGEAVEAAEAAVPADLAVEDLPEADGLVVEPVALEELEAPEGMDDAHVADEAGQQEAAAAQAQDEAQLQDDDALDAPAAADAPDMAIDAPEADVVDTVEAQEASDATEVPDIAEISAQPEQSGEAATEAPSEPDSMADSPEAADAAPLEAKEVEIPVEEPIADSVDSEQPEQASQTEASTPEAPAAATISAPATDDAIPVAEAAPVVAEPIMPEPVASEPVATPETAEEPKLEPAPLAPVAEPAQDASRTEPAQDAPSSEPAQSVVSAPVAGPEIAKEPKAPKSVDKTAVPAQRKTASIAEIYEGMDIQEALDHYLRNEPELQMVAFYLGDQEFTVPTVIVQEVIHYSEAAKLPIAPPFVAGVINLRGKVTPLVYLRDVLEVKQGRQSDDRFIIVCRFQGLQVGLIIERVHTMYRVSQSDIDWGIESHLGINVDFVSGLLKMNENLLGIVSVDKIVTSILQDF